MSDSIQPSAFKQQTRKARKSHKCCECHQEISIGEKYDYVSGIWEDNPDSYKTCMSCLAVRDDYWDKTGEFPAFEHLKECISDSCFCMSYGVNEFIADYPELESEFKKLFSKELAKDGE